MDNDRMIHMLAVANKMVEIGTSANIDEKELKELFVLGFVHDIGYKFGKNENHNIIGGNILKDNGYKYWKEVYYHGKLTNEYSSKYLDILNMADMQVNKYGQDVGYEKRLEDIKSRYGEDSIQYINAKELIDYLKNVDLTR